MIFLSSLRRIYAKTLQCDGELPCKTCKDYETECIPGKGRIAAPSLPRSNRDSGDQYVAYVAKSRAGSSTGASSDASSVNGRERPQPYWLEKIPPKISDEIPKSYVEKEGDSEMAKKLQPFTLPPLSLPPLGTPTASQIATQMSPSDESPSAFETGAALGIPQAHHDNQLDAEAFDWGHGLLPAYYPDGSSADMSLGGFDAQAAGDLWPSGGTDDFWGL